jgi:hypothetical protein
MGHDTYDHTPREGCACDLCLTYQDERNALADDASDAARDHQEAHGGPAEGASLVCLTCPALVDTGYVLCPECTTGREEGDDLPTEHGWRPVAGTTAWWAALDAAVERRDRAEVARLTGSQDPATASDVEAFVSMLDASAHHAMARSEMETACGRVRA